MCVPLLTCFFATFRGLGSTSRFSYKCSRLSWHELNAVVAVAFLLCLFLDEMQLWGLPRSFMWWLWNVTVRSYQLDYILKIRSSNFDEILFFSLKLKLFSLIELDGPPLETLLKLCKTLSSIYCWLPHPETVPDSWFCCWCPRPPRWACWQPKRKSILKRSLLTAIFFVLCCRLHKPFFIILRSCSVSSFFFYFGTDEILQFLPLRVHNPSWLRKRLV